MSWACCSALVFWLSPAPPAVEPEAQVLDLAQNATEFFRNESCGKCVPCRLGSQKLVLIGERLVSRPGDPAEQAELMEQVRVLQETMEQTSICSLGTSAPKPMASVFEHDWRRTSRGESHDKST